MSTSNATLPRAPGASGTASRSGTAVQNTAGSPGVAPATLAIRTWRLPRQPNPPLPHSRIQIRSSGARPGFVKLIVSRPLQCSPRSLPASATS
jgi:hypothetical protein